MTLAIDITDGRGLSNEVRTVEEEQGNAVFAVSFCSTGPLTSCTLLTTQSASVLKVGMPCAS